MANASAQRFEFIGHALRGDGPFRPVVNTDGFGVAVSVGSSYLVRYPRESQEKYARRNELAFYASPLAEACSRFTGYLATRSPTRQMPHKLYELMEADVDGKGSSVEIFWSQFMVEAKARGSMLLLVDMPAEMARSMADQLRRRVVPYWTPYAPESLSDYAVGDDGKFDFVEFGGQFKGADGKAVDCTWRFDREAWAATDKEKNKLAGDAHGLGECPMLIFTEGGDFPHFGPFAAIADLSKRLFNLDSELDEILRAQTFSLLTMQVPEDSTTVQKLEAAKAVGETIGTNNLMVHSGTTPAFIAPDSGPAEVYLKRIDKLQARIDELGLRVASVDAQESGIAMQMRFQAINAELARFAAGIEDLERRAWDLSRRWLAMTAAPVIQWPRDFQIADVKAEVALLTEMQGAAMPPAVISEQQRRVASLQFGGLDQEAKDAIDSAIGERSLAVT